MLRLIALFTVFFISYPNTSFSQDKAIVVENIWNNELDDYNPAVYIEKLLAVLKETLQVKEIIQEPETLKVTKREDDWNKKIQNNIEQRISAGNNAYYIAVAGELKLPAFNLGKFLFKNPLRSSKFVFTIHIYNNKGTELTGDTLVNRGCVVKKVVEEKGSKFFYANYESFNYDMQCHLEIIKKFLLQQPKLKKQQNSRKAEKD